MNQPKVFVSYAKTQRGLAKRLRDDLTTAGCDAWQFDLSARPGTESWKEILLRIEKSDFFIVLLSADALESRAVQEEISHAHYSSLNNDEQLPMIIPIMLEDGVIPPPEIIRKVRLNFKGNDYEGNFAELLRSLGMEPSPFAAATDLEATFTRSSEFDAKHEATVFAERLINYNPYVSSAFKAIHEARSSRDDGRTAIFPAETLTWTFEWLKKYGEPYVTRVFAYEFLVIFGFRWGVSSGFGMEERAVVKIVATLERRFEDSDKDYALHSDTLSLRFNGFQTMVVTPLLGQQEATVSG